jgi:hypothetical protein
MDQSKAMEYGSRKASPDVLKLRNIYISCPLHYQTYLIIYAIYKDGLPPKKQSKLVNTVH